MRINKFNNIFIFIKMSAEEQTTSIQMPCDKTLQYAVKTAIQKDKPIMLDYYGSKAKIVKTK